MIDITSHLNAVHRETGHRRIAAGEGRTVVLRRSYEASVEDVWDAITNPDRISRWFLPVSGDLRLGGRYQPEGNAGGEIRHCEPPRLLVVTWVYGESPADADVGEVEVRLTPGEDGRTSFELEHTAVVDDQRRAQYGPGAVGVGWDLGLLGLGLHLGGGSIEDPGPWAVSDEGREFMTRSSTAWGAALEAAGASSAQAAAAVRNTTLAYAPEPPSTPDPRA